MIRNKIKSILASTDILMTELNARLNELNGTDYTLANLSKKLSNGTIRYDEVQQIADILGYEIVWIKKDPGN